MNYRDRLILELETKEARLIEIEEKDKYNIIDTVKNQIKTLEAKINLFDWIQENQSMDIPTDLILGLEQRQAYYMANKKELEYKFEKIELFNSKIEEIIKKFQGKVYNVKFDTYIKEMFDYDFTVAWEKYRGQNNKDVIKLSTKSFSVYYGEKNSKGDLSRVSSALYKDDCYIDFKIIDKRIDFSETKTRVENILEFLRGYLVTNEAKFFDFYYNEDKKENIKEQLVALLKDVQLSESEDKTEIKDFINRKW